MSILAAFGLKKTYVTRTLFEGVSFELGPRDKVGLVGVNGCGKTTLFKLLTGEETPDDGSVSVNRETRLGATQQSVDGLTDTVYDATLAVFDSLLKMERELDTINARIAAGESGLDSLVKRQGVLRERYEFEGGLTYKSRTRSTLLGLGFTEAELSKELSSMSGGQRNKAQLARLLLGGANLLLLDEPTNHLDIDSIAWLEDYLRAYNGAFIVISHDRYFLDRVTNRTFELKNAWLTVSEGNYTRHLELQQNEQEAVRRVYYRTQKEIRRLEGVVEQQRRWGQEHNFITAASKLKQIDRLKAALVAPEKEPEGIRFHFTAREAGGNEVLVCEDLAKSYEKRIFENASFLVRKGERAFLLGPNGCGKTTLLRIIMGREQADKGATRLGAHVKAGYYEQTMRSLHNENTVLGEIWDEYPRLSQTEVRSALAAFLFRGDDVNKTVSMLSGGEKARVQLLKLMLSSSNLLLLDEPTNHLDIASREALEDALTDYDGTMLVVTHDRYLVNRLADRILYMTENGVEEFVGGFDEFWETYQERRARAQQKENAPKKQERPNLYKEQKDKQAAVVRAAGELRRAEKRVTDTEEEIARLDEQLVDPATAGDYMLAMELGAKAGEKRNELAELYAAWEDAQRRYDKLTEE
ncbi:MAG TPA: ABC-F family ATP-binding cassette domain-containing protein [Clostridia bacterium]|nr:ABC-F family ATP-binding cassette domain-containing protein [Clostridia bacterium]